MNKKLAVGLAVAAIAVFAIAWAAAPVFAAQALIRAAKAGDADRIEQLVDFPALRESLKEELTTELAAHMRRDPRMADSTLGGLGMMLAPMLLSGAIDATVTPEVVAQMVTTARLRHGAVPHGAARPVQVAVGGRRHPDRGPLTGVSPAPRNARREPRTVPCRPSKPGPSRPRRSTPA